MFIYVKDWSWRFKVVLDNDGKETELATFDVPKDANGRHQDSMKSITFKEAVAKATQIAKAMECEVVLHELTTKECESAIMENRVTKHHAAYLLRKVKEAERHTCPTCHRCGDRS